MKLLFQIILLSVFACACNTNTESKTPKTSLKTDTAVCSISTGYDNEKEYFLIINNDTSCFSLFVNSNSMGNVVIEYRRGSIKIPSYNQTVDTDAVSDNLNPKVKCPIENYPQQLAELKLLLDEVDKNYKLRELQWLSVSMVDIYEFSENITELYYAKYGKNISSIRHKQASELIQQTRYFADITSVLLSYNVIVNEISIDQLVCYKPNNHSEELLDGVVIFSIKPKE